ncbi:hypothetical protein F0237_01245 [Vibrio tubiashii]|uniref:Uncharacterized protein n=1 Tax=Vibrio tubiashii TaxID=29498 RepID=A0AAE5LGD5_9VIBR|nr:hypothetical protein [Vibrio tubiashii]NOI79267.1 hypothetical protein [Vibrio tubiashii]
MSPLEHISEPSFTSSARGLMTLFLIGLVKIVIGVEFTTNVIAIPWLPKIELTHIHLLTHLYWGLVAYAVYRYILHNVVNFREVKFDSLYQALQPANIGERFVYSNIFTSGGYYEVSKKLADDTISNNCITLKQYVDENETACSFSFYFDSSYTFELIDCQVTPHYSCEDFVVNIPELSDKWGLYHYCGAPGDEEGYRVKHFGDYKFSIYGLIFHKYIKLLLTEKRTFDLVLPILLNIGLFLVWFTNLVT